MDVVEEEDGPELTFTLEEDPNRKDQLFSFRKEQATPLKDYHAKEQQLLQEGKLGSAEFSARLRRVTFGTFDSEPACLIVFRVDFQTAKKGWFRFRNATVEAEFEEPAGHDDGDTASDDDDDDEDEEYTGPLIRKINPELIRGHISTAAATLGLGVVVPILPAGGAGISAEYKVTSPREGLHLIQGRLMGSPETRVKWTMNENEVNKGGIYEQPVFAVIVRHAEDQPFTMTLKIKATTYGGLPVKGKGGSRILFNPSRSSSKKSSKSTTRLTNGSFEVGSHQFTSSQETLVAPPELDKIDLETLTQMRAVLLSSQGPGAGPALPLVEGSGTGIESLMV
ncbi:MAG: hypothetical protein Q9166_006537 [cf. Caloplaca sp. 2 TL-2023]